MNKNFFLTPLLFTLIQYGVAQEKGALMPVKSTIKIEEGDSNETIIQKAAHVVPTANQYNALRNEFIAFIHFGPNTFTRMEWGSGKEDPKIVDLKELHTDQWCEAMKAAGMKMVILTVKHHDGFVLWQSRYTKHGIMSTPFQQGKGDVLKELVASCQKYGLKVGVYLSPADLYQIENPEGLYGNLSKYTKRTIPRQVTGRPFKNKTTFQFEVDDYNEYFLNQLFELLTEYGPIHEVWFDGAHPKTKGGQKYNYQAWKKLIKTLAPQAVIFGKEDIRWCGNEAGKTRATEWNVLPYAEDPALMNNFGDLTAESLGGRADLYKGKFLHYQQAETNTSIREGWFYRDDNYQKVRSADDVFDIYERSVGGNSTFLLNIPPNRDGKFSPADVAVLKEVGKRINETYQNDLFAKASGPKEVLDHDASSYTLLPGVTGEIIISTPKTITLNRLLLQEAVATHSERIEKFTLDAWIDNQWKDVASATNVCYKRILRFPEVASNKFRIRVLEDRFIPAISSIEAYYYPARPPQLQVDRDMKGLVSIMPKASNFGWKPHGEDATKNLSTDYTIFYTLNGTEPTEKSMHYQGPFLASPGEIKAIAIDKNNLKGSIVSQTLGIAKQDWKVLEASSEMAKHPASSAIDADQRTYWQSEEQAGTHTITIDLGKSYSLTGLIYTPQNLHPEGMLEKGVIKTSSDGKNWKTLGTVAFGNLINDPTARTHYFDQAPSARFVRIESETIATKGKSFAIAELDFLIKK